MRIQTGRAIILLVDSHQEVLDFITEDLSDIFFVLQANCIADARVILEREQVDLIVSELALPEGNGFEFCQQVKNNLSTAHTPFVLLTAQNSLQAKIEGLGNGADAFIEKPFSPSFLKAQITSLLVNRQSVRAHTYSLQSDTARLDEDATHLFLCKVRTLIGDHIEEPGLCVDMLADKLHISRPTLYRKIKQISRVSPNELINEMRLTRAKELLARGDYRIYEISDKVGFASPSSFIRNFRKHFGLSPKEWGQNFHRPV